MDELLPQITRQPSRKIAMLFSETYKRAISLDGAPPESERDNSSDTLLGNQARVSKPIEITDQGVFVGHQQRRKHPSVMRKIWNVWND
jgi:hypothetical protein